MNDVQTLLHDYGPLLVFANVLLEQAGLPLPAYPILVAAAEDDAGVGTAMAA